MFKNIQLNKNGQKYQGVRIVSFGVFIVNFEHISHLSSVSIVNFEHVIACWVTVSDFRPKSILKIILIS